MKKVELSKYLKEELENQKFNNGSANSKAVGFRATDTDFFEDIKNKSNIETAFKASIEESNYQNEYIGKVINEKSAERLVSSIAWAEFAYNEDAYIKVEEVLIEETDFAESFGMDENFNADIEDISYHIEQYFISTGQNYNLDDKDYDSLNAYFIDIVESNEFIKYDDFLKVYNNENSNLATL